VISGSFLARNELVASAFARFLRASLHRSQILRDLVPIQAEAAESTCVRRLILLRFLKGKFGTVCSNPLFQNGSLNRRGSAYLAATRAFWVSAPIRGMVFP
jgi:hypothetical protein